MLDDFEDLKDSNTFLDDLEEDDAPPKPKKKRKGRPSFSSSSGSAKGFMGMSPIQTFIISALFFFSVCVLGFFVLLITGKIVLPV
jgi:hypothetical protein